MFFANTVHKKTVSARKTRIRRFQNNPIAFRRGPIEDEEDVAAAALVIVSAERERKRERECKRARFERMKKCESESETKAKRMVDARSFRALFFIQESF